jgi:hypothetical protein
LTLAGLPYPSTSKSFINAGFYFHKRHWKRATLRFKAGRALTNSRISSIILINSGPANIKKLETIFKRQINNDESSSYWRIIGEQTMETIMRVYPRHKARGRSIYCSGRSHRYWTFCRPGNMAIFKTRAAAEQFVTEDPFILEGLVTISSHSGLG